MKTLLFLPFLLFFSCGDSPSSNSPAVVEQNSQGDKAESKYLNFFTHNPQYKSTAFDYPVGNPDAKGYYNAQGFQKNNHLGDDWNANTGGNTDLGDPINAISNGYVVFAEDLKGGWGKVVRVVHMLAGSNPTWVESVYAHCDSILVEKGQGVKIGEQIATIGNADGAYWAHLHLEIRDSLDMPIGGGYGTQTKGYLDPTIFIEQHRNIPQ